MGKWEWGTREERRRKIREGKRAKKRKEDKKNNMTHTYIYDAKRKAVVPFLVAVRETEARETNTRQVLQRGGLADQIKIRLSITSPSELPW